VEPHAAVADEWTRPIASGSCELAPVAPVRVDAPRFDGVYRAFFDDVSRWVRALGGPDAEREDLVQDVFLIVHRRLGDFDGNNVRGWLYRITRNRVRDFRRLRWFRLLLGSVRVDDAAAASASDSPDAALCNREKQRLLAQLLSKLSEVERVAFVLFEIEGCSGEEIARLQNVPVNTVWARIHKARAKLAARAARLRRAGRGDPRP
jgi:RNA polymerase sigma-70 factor, ECF subfamily